MNQRMHCRFEDIESGRVLEVDLSLDRKGEMSEGRVGEKTEQVPTQDKSTVE